ncbi:MULTISPECIES: GpE family phage tail protein [Moraxella]|uniref:GpE family phage tail protein n=1 Tax=Moraxella catarrhalis TaxID=480 RepID=A0A7Z0UXZ0_MORCA|nr:GpE family phage tail protein [Moraxella catarrhalis]OAV00231.1 hypothetical protein AO382_1381 [Moraxella catarrhalis]
MIANLAVVFGWTPADCGEMTVGELMMWHELAIERQEAKL